MKLSLALVAAAAARSECFERPAHRPRGKLNLLQNPGFGTGEVVAYEKVYKDGFQAADCVKDDMLEFADKFGKNRHAYKADFVDVSIVRYADVVASEDQEKMTTAVCFDFCRTIDGAGFFGLHNGRDCYCTPYYKTAAGDSSQCDAPCDGAPHTSCGGKTKSQLYAMHNCQDSAQEVQELRSHAQTVVSYCRNKGDTGLKDAIQKLGEDFQKVAGQVGDPSASDNAQHAKEFAGRMEKAINRAHKLADHLEELIKTAGAVPQKKSLSVDEQRLADQVQVDLKAGIKDAFAYCGAELGEIYAVPNEEKFAGKALKEYLPFTHFSGHKGLGKVPQDMNMASCKGKEMMITATTTMSNCAMACSQYGSHATDFVGRCVAFQFYEAPDVAKITTYRWCAYGINAGWITTMEQLERCEYEESTYWCPQVSQYWCDQHEAVFKGGEASEAGLCTLFEEVEEVNLYIAPGCREHDGPASFLQKKKGEKHNVRCVANFAKSKDVEHRMNSKEAGVKRIEVHELNRCLDDGAK